MKFFLIGFAGGIGVLLRFVVCGSGQKLAAGIFPLGTVIVNARQAPANRVPTSAPARPGRAGRVSADPAHSRGSS